MSFEDELSGRLQEAAEDLTIPSGSLSSVQARAETRQGRRQLATRAGSTVSALVVVIAGGWFLLQQSSDNQLVGTAGTAINADQDSSSLDAEGSDTDQAGDEADGGTDADTDRLATGTQPSFLTVELQPSGVEGWQQVLPPTAAAVATRYDFTGGATVTEVDDDWYVDRGSGWQQLATPEELDVLAIDAHDPDKLVVAGVVTAGECDSYMAVATLENDRWTIQRVPSEFAPGIRSVPLAAQVRSTRDITVLSTAERFMAEPLCLLRYLLASSSVFVDEPGSAPDELGGELGGELDGELDGELAGELDGELDSELDGEADETGGDVSETDGGIPDIILGGVTVEAWDTSLESSINLSLGEVVEASVEDFGIKVTTTGGEQYFISLTELANLRPFDTQYQAVLASARVTDDWAKPVDPQIEALLEAKWVVRLSELADFGLADFGLADFGQDSGRNSERVKSWRVTNLHHATRQGAQTVPTTAALGVVDDEVIYTFAGQIGDIQTGAPAVGILPSYGGEQLETVEPSDEGAARAVKHFSRDGAVTAMPLRLGPADKNSSGGDSAGTGSSGTGSSGRRYLDAIRQGDLEVFAEVADGETTISAGDDHWRLVDLCGNDYGWAKLGEHGDKLRLIAFVDGHQRLYQLEQG